LLRRLRQPKEGLGERRTQGEMDKEIFELTRELHFLDVRLRLASHHPGNSELRQQLEDRRATAAAKLAEAEAARTWTTNGSTTAA
jgi:hypothetical protein